MTALRKSSQQVVERAKSERRYRCGRVPSRRRDLQRHSPTWRSREAEGSSFPKSSLESLFRERERRRLRHPIFRRIVSASLSTRPWRWRALHPKTKAAGFPRNRLIRARCPIFGWPIPPGMTSRRNSASGLRVGQRRPRSRRTRRSPIPMALLLSTNDRGRRSRTLQVSREITRLPAGTSLHLP